MVEYPGHGLFPKLAFQDFQALNHGDPGVNHHGQLPGKQGHILQAHELEQPQAWAGGAAAGGFLSGLGSCGSHRRVLLCKISSNSSCRGEAASAVFRSMAPEK